MKWLRRITHSDSNAEAILVILAPVLAVGVSIGVLAYYVSPLFAGR